VLRRNADLVLAGVLAAAAGYVVLETHSVVLRTAFALPLLLFLPGYTLTAVLFVRQRLDAPRRLLLSISLSLALAIAGALVLDLTSSGLRARNWTLLLFELTTWAVAFAALRRHGLRRERLTFPRLRLLDAVLFALAAVVVGGAVALARTPLPAKNAVGYTALWIEPSRDGWSLTVGATSAELRPTSYRLELRAAKAPFLTRSLRLAPGQRWQEVVRLPQRLRTRPVHALLYLGSKPTVPYRSVALRRG
jgi:uncharacterized membrane protein